MANKTKYTTLFDSPLLDRNLKFQSTNSIARFNSNKNNFKSGKITNASFDDDSVEVVSDNILVVKKGRLRMEVKIEDIKIQHNVFQDVDYAEKSDNSYMLSKPIHFSHEKSFVNLTREFCRFVCEILICIKSFKQTYLYFISLDGIFIKNFRKQILNYYLRLLLSCYFSIVRSFFLRPNKTPEYTHLIYFLI